MCLNEIAPKREFCRWSALFLSGVKLVLQEYWTSAKLTFNGTSRLLVAPQILKWKILMKTGESIYTKYQYCQVCLWSEKYVVSIPWSEKYNRFRLYCLPVKAILNLNCLTFLVEIIKWKEEVIFLFQCPSFRSQKSQRYRTDYGQSFDWISWKK